MVDTTSSAATSQSSSGNTTSQSASGNSGAQTGASQQTQASTNSSATTAPARPDFFPESFWDKDKGPKWEDFGKHYSEIVTRDAAEQVRRNALPQRPEDVRIELPKEFPIPQGVEFKLDPAKPEFGKLQQFAVKRGLDQEAVSELVGLYAETLVGDATAMQKAIAAELAKLGANATPRITAINTFLTGILGETDAKALGGMMVSAATVTALEKLVGKFASQGGASFSQAHREPAGRQGLVTEEQWAKMSAAERLDYSRSPAAQAEMARRNAAA